MNRSLANAEQPKKQFLAASLRPSAPSDPQLVQPSIWQRVKPGEVRILGRLNERTVQTVRVKYRLRKYWAKLGAVSDPDASRLLKRQAEVLSFLTLREFEDISTVEHCLVDHERFYILYEDLPPGRPLFKRGAMSPEKALCSTIFIAEINRRLLEYGIYHLDNKPSNIWEAKDGRLILIDFELARFANDVSLSGQERLNLGGTPFYMSARRLKQFVTGTILETPALTPADEIASLSMTLLTLMVSARTVTRTFSSSNLPIDEELAELKGRPAWIRKQEGWIPRPVIDLILDGYDGRYVTVEDFIRACQEALVKIKGFTPDRGDELVDVERALALGRTKEVVMETPT
jgi:hypothetical protein